MILDYTLTKEEALKAAIDGKIIACEAWPGKVFSWDGENFVNLEGVQIYPHKSAKFNWAIVTLRHYCAAEYCIYNRNGKCAESDIMAVFNRGCQINIKQKYIG